jgi:hypothetical protein
MSCTPSSMGVKRSSVARSRETTLFRAAAWSDPRRTLPGSSSSHSAKAKRAYGACPSSARSTFHNSELCCHPPIVRFPDPISANTRSSPTRRVSFG